MDDYTEICPLLSIGRDRPVRCLGIRCELFWRNRYGDSACAFLKLADATDAADGR